MFQMKPALKKSMFHLAWSPDSLPTTDAITPLLEYLDNHLIALNSALLPRNFERVMSLVWDTCVTELAHQMDGHSQDKLPGFYDRLYEALDILAEFFHADGKGLGVDGLKTGKNIFSFYKCGFNCFKILSYEIKCNKVITVTNIKKSIEMVDQILTIDN